MNGLFKARMPGKDGFKSSIKLLETFHLSLLAAEKKKLTSFVTRHFYNKLVASIKDACEVLYALNGQPAFVVVSEFSDTFNCLQKELCHYHLKYIKSNDWYDIGVSLHNILDTYYHLFEKFFQTRRCKWCDFDLNQSWSLTLTDALLNKQASACIGLGYSLDDLLISARQVWGYLPEPIVKTKPTKAARPIKTIILV